MALPPKKPSYGGGITSPVHHEHASVANQGGGCEGAVTVSGTASKTGWTLVEVRALVTPGWHANPLDPAAVKAGEQITAAANWSGSVAGAICQGGACGGDGKNTVAVQLLWEENGSGGMPNQEWEGLPDVQFFGDCTM